MAWAMAKPAWAMASGLRRSTPVARSSKRVGAGVAIKKGLLACCAWPRTPASCQSGMPACAAISKDRLRALWRRAKAMRGAVLAMSSPKTSTASAASASLTVASRAPPACMMARANWFNSASAAAMPPLKLSSPTKRFKLWLLSIEARGEPMPMTSPLLRISASRLVAASESKASNTPSAAFAPAWRRRASLLTKWLPKRPRSQRK